MLLDDLANPFRTLIKYCVNGLPSMFLGSFLATRHDVAVFSVLITDANQDSWNSFLIKIVASQGEEASKEPSIIDSLIKQLQEYTGYKKFEVFPVRMFSNKFTKTTRNQSSTYRERIAILEAVSEAQALLKGRTFVVSDNRNCHLKWHDIEIFGSMLTKVPLFRETITDIIWMDR